METEYKCAYCEQVLDSYREWGGEAIIIVPCDNCTTPGSDELSDAYMDGYQAAFDDNN